MDACTHAKSTKPFPAKRQLLFLTERSRRTTTTGEGPDLFTPSPSRPTNSLINLDCRQNGAYILWRYIIYSVMFHDSAGKHVLLIRDRSSSSLICLRTTNFCNIQYSDALMLTLILTPHVTRISSLPLLNANQEYPKDMPTFPISSFSVSTSSSSSFCS